MQNYLDLTFVLSVFDENEVIINENLPKSKMIRM